MTEGPQEEEQRHRAEVAEARPGWRWWAAMVLTSVLGPAVAIGVSSASRRHSEQALCEVIVLSDDAYQKNPRPSSTVQELAAAMTRLRHKYRC